MIWIFLLALGLLAALPFAAEWARAPMDEGLRQNAPGRFVDLPNGRVHLRWFGPARGPIMVCVHGLSTPSFVWEGLGPRIGDLGYRVLVMDLFGRGYSDRPEGPQDSAFFIEQVEAVMAAEGVQDDITLLGFSMGGAIATAMVAKEPSRYRRLILVAPVGLGHRLGWLADTGANLPLIGDWLFYTFYPAQLRRGIAAERTAGTAPLTIAKQQAAETTRRGFFRSVLRAIRGILAEDMSAAHRTIAAAGVPVVAIWGEADSIIPIDRLGALAQLNRNAAQEVIPGAGHGLPYANLDALAARISDVLDEQ